MIKEKEYYHYKGMTEDSSFDFWLAEYKPDQDLSVKIVVNRGTPEANILTVQKDNFTEMVERGLVVPVKETA
jgi:hypothetical protein